MDSDLFCFIRFWQIVSAISFCIIKYPQKEVTVFQSLFPLPTYILRQLINQSQFPSSGHSTFSLMCQIRLNIFSHKMRFSRHTVRFFSIRYRCESKQSCLINTYIVESLARKAGKNYFSVIYRPKVIIVGHWFRLSNN